MMENENLEYLKDEDVEDEKLDIIFENSVLAEYDKSSESIEQRFEQQDWLDAEKKVSYLEQTVLKCLKNLGLGNTDNTETEIKLYPVAGEDVYTNSRHLLSEWKGQSLLFEDYIINKYIEIKNKKNDQVIFEILKILRLFDNLKKNFESFTKKMSKSKILEKIRTILSTLKHHDKYSECVSILDGLESNSKNDKVKNNKKDKKIKKEKPVSKAEAIKTNNLLTKYKTKIETLLNTFNKDSLNTNYGFGQSDIIELIGITFMYVAWYVLNHSEKYTKKSKLVDVYEIIVAIQRFINSCQVYEGKSMQNSINKQKISNTMLSDLKFWQEELSEIYEFDGFKVYDIAPKLFVYTNYDSYIPQKGIQPKRNQFELIKTVKDNLINHPNDGLLVVLKAPISSGKTFSVTALINLMKTIRDQRKTSGHIMPELIFCCNLRSVKSQVANIAYNSEIKFAIGSVVKNKLRITNHNTCKSETERQLIICGPDAAERLLKKDFERANKEGNENKYWLFLDEPTVGADQFGSDSLNKNVSVLMNMPKYTILSSATMPEFENMSDLIKIHKEKFPNIQLHTIYSGEIQIGCDVKFHNNDMILPHLLCKNKQDLENVIRRIESNPFLGRMYTYKVVRQLWNDLSPLTSKVPDLKLMFKDVNNLSSDKIRIEAINMLKSMTELADNIIEQLCSINFVNSLRKYDDVEENKEKDNDNAIVFGDEQDEEDAEINYENLGTTQAYRFLGMNLIASPNPIDFCIKNFKPLLNKLKENGVESSSKIIDKYTKELSSYNKLMEKLKDNMSKFDNSSKNMQNAINSNMHDFKDNFANKKRDVMDIFDNKVGKAESSGKISIDEKTSMQIQQLEQTKKPSINLPEWAQINTLQHIKFFSKNHIKNINPRLIRAQYPVELLPLDSNIPDEVMLLLMCGVGIYSPSDTKLDQNYTRFVLEMALSGQLAYLVADASISYGTNYPIVRLFVTDDFAKQHSVYTLLQLMGRPGRVGHSYKAEVFLQQYAADLLLNFSHNINHQLGLIEANNIQKTVDGIVQKNLEIVRKLEEQKRQEEQQKIDEINKLEEQKKLEEQLRLEREEKERRILEEQEKKKMEEQQKLRNSNQWRRNEQPIKSGTYIAPFAKKNVNQDNEWTTVSDKRKATSRWKN